MMSGAGPDSRTHLAIIGLAVAMVLAFPTWTAAESSGIHVIVDGPPIDLSVPPVIRHGRVLVPLQDMLTPLRVAGSIHNGRITVSSGSPGGSEVTLQLGSVRGTVRLLRPNGPDCQETTLDVGPTLVDGHPMVPLRFLAEGVGAAVHWDASTYTVLLHVPAGRLRPPISVLPSVKPVKVSGAWRIKESHTALTCATCGEQPLHLNFAYPGATRLGTGIKFQVTVTKLEPETLTLREPLNLGVLITRNLCPTIWKGLLPPLVGSVPPGTVHFEFVWSQADTSPQKLLNAGFYQAWLIYPITIAYAVNGNDSVEKFSPRYHVVSLPIP